MADENVKAGGGKSNRPRVTHHGPYKMGDVEIACAVLEDGRRGYVMTSLRQAIGIKKKLGIPQFKDFLGEIAPNALKTLEKTDPPKEVVMPHGGRVGQWVPAGVLTEVVSSVVDAALDGTLDERRKGMVAPCRVIYRALARVGEEALIDEATGYQSQRPENALQELLNRLVRESARDWDRRFHPDFYKAVCGLFGFKYDDQHRPLPSIVGKITADWVYGAIVPSEIMAEIKTRRGQEKFHQWLTEDGLNLLGKQVDAVTMVARTSVDYQDFVSRCSVAFYRPGAQVGFVFPHAAE